MELPKGWSAGRLSEFIQPYVDKVSPSSYPDLPFIGMDHVEAHSTKIIGTVPAGQMKSQAVRFHTNDVLYGRLRPYLNKVTQPQFDGLASAEFIVFRGNSLIDSDFLRYRLNSQDFVGFASRLNEGDRPRVKFDQIGDFNVHVPPIAEQHRIVEKINTLFQEIDDGVESLQNAKKSIKLYRQSLLKSAFEGRLTAEWRKMNRDKLKIPNALLKRVCAAHASRVHDSAYSKVQTDSRGKTHGLNKRQVGAGRVQDASSWTIDIDTESWTVCKIGDVLEPVEKTEKGEKDRLIWYVDISSIDNETNTITAPKRLRLAEAPTRARQKIRLGDVLFSTVRPYLRNIAFVEGILDGEIASTGFAVLRGVGGIDPRYLFYKSISYKFVSALTGEQYGVSYPAVKQEQVRDQPFELRSIAEQSEIVRILDTNFQVLKELSKEIDSALASAEVLRQSILKMAFSGQLVGQNSREEPATVLLERLRASPARTQTIKKGVKSDASR